MYTAYDSLKYKGEGRMQSSIARINTQKFTWRFAAVAFAVALVTGIGVMASTAGASVVTLVVDEDGLASTLNCNHPSAVAHATVTAAIAAANAGDVIKVCPGAYAENVVVDKALSLRGAKKGVDVSSRTFGSADESTITGLVTVQAASVRLEGFSLTNPGQGLGVIVKTAATNTFIKENIVKTVGSTTFVGPTVGIYLELGPDSVRIEENMISDVKSQTGSAQGILIGDSTSANPSLDIRVEGNRISDLASVAKGAYGIQANNGASTSPAATGYTELVAVGNNISGLTGNWVHAIGLEGETPEVDVRQNTISGLTDLTPTPVNDAVGVFFEANPFFFTGSVEGNSLAVGTGYGIAVHPALTAQYPSLSVEGDCNWWGAASGPGSIGTGSGSLVTAGVDFGPWLKKDKLKKDC
jgi:hypothetical protein